MFNAQELYDYALTHSQEYIEDEYVSFLLHLIEKNFEMASNLLNSLIIENRLNPGEIEISEQFVANCNFIHVASDHRSEIDWENELKDSKE